MAVTHTADLDQLKALVQAIEPPTRLEHLTAALIGELIGVSVAVAKSGFQHGADAGTAGRQERFLRIECKRYRDDTSLNDRLLLGEIDQAIVADPALEAWILAATREADEQLERQLFNHGNGFGIAIIVMDWKSHDEPALAALLASNPALVSNLLGPVAGALAARLAIPLGAAIERLREVDSKIRAITDSNRQYLAHADVSRAIASVPGNASLALAHPLFDAALIPDALRAYRVMKLPV